MINLAIIIGIILIIPAIFAINYLKNSRLDNAIAVKMNQYDNGIMVAIGVNAVQNDDEKLIYLYNDRLAPGHSYLVTLNYSTNSLNVIVHDGCSMSRGCNNFYGRFYHEYETRLTESEVEKIKTVAATTFNYDTADPDSKSGRRVFLEDLRDLYPHIDELTGALEYIARDDEAGPMINSKTTAREFGDSYLDSILEEIRDDQEEREE